MGPYFIQNYSLPGRQHPLTLLDISMMTMSGPHILINGAVMSAINSVSFALPLIVIIRKTATILYLRLSNIESNIHFK